MPNLPCVCLVNLSGCALLGVEISWGLLSTAVWSVCCCWKEELLVFNRVFCVVVLEKVFSWCNQRRKNWRVERQRAWQLRCLQLLVHTLVPFQKEIESINTWKLLARLHYPDKHIKQTKTLGCCHCECCKYYFTNNNFSFVPIVVNMKTWLLW